MKAAGRILHLQSGGGATGGISAYVDTLVRATALSEFAFTVTVGHGERTRLAGSLKYNPSRIVEIDTSYTFRFFWKFVHTILGIIREHHIELVHSHALRSGLVCALLNLLYGVPFVHTNHGLRFKQKNRVLERFLFVMIELFVLWRARLVVCVRPADAEYLRGVAGVRQQKIEKIVTRIDFGDSRLPTPSLRYFERRPVLIGIGSVIRVKRVDRFIDWLQALCAIGVDFEAVWLGDGALRPEMEKRAKASEVAIRWMGHVDAASLRNELAKSTLLLLTSEYEVLPLSALEAMLCGSPVVTTEFFGVSDFVRSGETGLVLPVDVAPIEAAEAISALLADQRRLHLMAERAFEMVRATFVGAERMAGEYAERYRDILRPVG